jgi:DHA3 family macrolide efflux protein-like MFS transporter
MISLLLHERRFSVLLAGQLFSKIGDGIHELVFVIAVLNITNNGIVAAGYIYFARFIPYLILGPVGGVLADTFSRRRLMLSADVVRAMITGGFCALLLANRVDTLLLALLGMLMTAFRALFQPAFQAAIPALVSAQSLPPANAATQVVSELGGLIGPALGGALLVALVNPGHVLLLDVITYLVSALCVSLVRLPQAVHDGSQRLRQLSLRGVLGDFLRHLPKVSAQPALLVSIAYSAACILFAGCALRILIPALIKEGGHSDSLIGFSMSLMALGTIIGALLCPRVTTDYRTPRLMLYWGAYGVALALLPLCMFDSSWFLLTCLILGAVGAFVDVILACNIQQQSDAQSVGKNFGLFSTLANTGEAMSGGVAGLLAQCASVSASLSVIGIFIVSVAYFGQRKAAGRSI